jgi:hypothetical protein
LLKRARVNLVLSPIQESMFETVYGGLDKTQTKLRRVLCHYLDEETDLPRARRAQRPLNERTDWIRYRSWMARAWVGAHGQLKSRIGLAAKEECLRRGLRCDVSLADEDIIRGPAWLDFLGGARATVGVEGGSSVHDPDGAIFRAVEDYMAAHPRAPYDEVRAAVLGDRDNDVLISALSPRHLEAAATKTAQILIEGEYSGVLQPGAHYIPVKRDLSDLSDAFDQLADDTRVGAMIERAHEDVAASGRYTWRGFVRETLAAAPLRGAAMTPALQKELARLDAQDHMRTQLVRAEVAWGRSPPLVKDALRVMLAPLKPLLRRPQGWRAPAR